MSGPIVLTLTTLSLEMARPIEAFVVLRFLQGAGSAIIFSTSLAIFTAVGRPENRGRAMGIIVAHANVFDIV
jgi:MFS family permease